MTSSPRILETTLRDGSYVIDFKFTAVDTAKIASALEEAGFGMIEIGHGIGLGASEKGYGVAAETDEAYMRAAARSLKKADWGMFCIPGIATLDHVDLAAEHGMRFIRIGTDITRVKDAEPFVKRAKKHGMYVAANFMKSYAVSPEMFASQAKLAQSFGTDIVYIVDSAGGMLLSELRSYIEALKDNCSLPFGFHGHNNLGLSMATALCSVEMGASIIDTSLQGFGRSGGNTPTETFVAMMQRMGMCSEFDVIHLLDISETYIRPLIEKRGIESIDVVAGLAQFHSSYMPVISRIASKYGVDPRRLIVAVCEDDKLNAPEELVDRKAKELSAKSESVYLARFRLDQYHGEEQNH